MEDLGEILEELRKVEGDNSGHEEEIVPIRRSSTEGKRSMRRQNSGGSLVPTPPSPHDWGREDPRGVNDRSDAQNIQQPPDGLEQDLPPIQGDHKAQFYTSYHKVAEEYDKEFLKKHDEDLSTTLIFAGLFSAVASAFIIEVDSQLRPDPGDQTTALLRVLIYEINNSAFGGTVPPLPQWTGPPPTMVQVQAILFASLAVSLISAFLAMLGKQWLNRYESTDMRESAEERSQNRQRKLDGIVAWYFDHVMESLPLMLQAALLLLGCALGRYLWDISTTVAAVIVGITSSGLTFYLLVVVAGAASESCPYQTPGSHILRYMGRKLWGIVHPVRSTPRNTFGQPTDVSTTTSLPLPDQASDAAWSAAWSAASGRAQEPVPAPPSAAASGIALSVVHPWGRTLILALIGLPTKAYRLARKVKRWLYGRYSTLRRRLGQQMTPSHFRCISWTLQTSLDKTTHLKTLKHLWEMTELAGLDPILVTECFNVFVGCVSLNNHKLVVIQGLEELAAVSAGCLYRTFHHIRETDPTSSTLDSLLRRYARVFPLEVNFKGLPFYHTMVTIHALTHGQWDFVKFRWDNYKPVVQEHIPLAKHMLEVAQAEYQRLRRRKVPRWILRFAVHSLSLEPQPPASVIADCLTIVAVDLNCSKLNMKDVDESLRVERVSNLIIQKLRRDPNLNTTLQSKWKAIGTLFPYAIRSEQGGEPGMVDAILLAVENSPLILQWRPIRTSIAALLDESSPPSLNRVITSISPSIPWFFWTRAEKTVARWAAAVSVVPYSREVCQDVVNTLLSLSADDSLRSHIPIEIWAWLKKQPTLPPTCLGRYNGSQAPVVRHVQGLGDIEFTKSYLLLVWSKWDSLWDDGFTEMQILIREDFGGVGMGRHREDLIKHLRLLLGKLGPSSLLLLRCFKPGIVEDDIQKREEQYRRLLDILLEVDEGAMEILTKSRATFSCALPLMCP